MIKFKDPDAEESSAFDMIPISSSKSIQKSSPKFKDNLVDTFISLVKNITPEGANELKLFLLSTSLWDLLSSTSSEEFPLVNPTIVHYYFSIPDRVAAVCHLETDEFFFPFNFKHFTEESFTGSCLNRSIYALEKFEGFLMNKLVKLDSFWDSLNRQILNGLSKSSEQEFLASLFKNILQRNFSASKLKNILKRLIKNLSLSTRTVQGVFFDQFIKKGSLDYCDFSRLFSPFSSLLDDSNTFIMKLVFEILKIWSNDSWIFRTSFNVQLHYSSCLLIVLSLVSPEMFSLECEQSFMNGIQTRLDHSDSQIRLMASCVAEILNQMHPESENKLDFELDVFDEIVVHLRKCFEFTKIDLFEDSKYTPQKEKYHQVPSPSCDLPDLKEPEEEEDEDDLKPISSLLKEDKTCPNNSKSGLPKFLPDCLKVLRSNDDFESVKIVLENLANIFKSSSRLTRQLNSPSAFNTILTLQDSFEIEEFDSLRHFSMETFLLDQIKVVAPELVNGMFKSNKLVLSQKMELLKIICSSSQQLFKMTKESAAHATNDLSSLDYFENSFLVSENFVAKPANKNNQNNNDFLEHLCLPLLVQSVKHFDHFKRNHVMLLEKFLWLQAIILNFSQNYLLYDRLAERFLDFVHLTITSTDNKTTISGASTKIIEQIPIQKAILIGTCVVLSSWPASLSVLDYYPRLQGIYAFLDEITNGLGFQEDSQLQALGTSVALALQDLTDPQKLLKESADQMSFDMKSIKITELKTFK